MCIHWFQPGGWDSIWLICVPRSTIWWEIKLLFCATTILLYRPICSRSRPNHPRLRGGATWKVGFLNELCGIHITFTIVFKSSRCLGERWRMVVPPHLAYGDSGAGDSIPGQRAEKFPYYQDQNVLSCLLWLILKLKMLIIRWSHPHIWRQTCKTERCSLVRWGQS